MKRINICVLPMLVFGFLVFSTALLPAQCTGGTNAGALTPAPSTTTQTMTVTDGNYYTFVVAPASGCSFPTYTFSFCAGDGGSAGYDTQLTILDNTGAATGTFNDDACGLQSMLTFTPAAAGTYRVLVNSFFCTTGGGNATLAYVMTSGGGASGDPFYALSGNTTATASAGCYDLTAAANNQIGCAWNLTPSLDFSVAFNREFSVNLGNNDGGADGMTFTFQNDPRGLCACGAAGGSMGATGIVNSLSIEIDTYLNTEDRDDGMPTVLCFGGPNPDHLDIWLDGNINPPGACPSPGGARVIPAAVELTNGGAAYNVENGADHTLRVGWVPGGPGTLTVSLLNATGTMTYGTVAHSFDPMTVFGTNTPFFGFTGSTGGLSNNHSFCDPNIILDEADLELAAVVEGADVLLNWGYEGSADVANYIVSHSVDGQTWREMARGPELVSFADADAPVGLQHYRVQAVSQNGAVLAGASVQIMVAAVEAYSVFPVPAMERAFVLRADGQPFKVALYDLRGNLLREAVADGPTKLEIPVNDLAAGMYLLHLRDAAGVHVQKLRVE
ncbi:MAG: T9SS type A sorting domain-containing protein [Bacteroidota bacterium]